MRAPTEPDAPGVESMTEQVPECRQFLVGCLGGEVLVEVRCDGLVVLAVVRWFRRHQPSHPMASNLDPILGKLVMDPFCTVALAAAPKGCPDIE